jgi:hypothetical protein
MYQFRSIICLFFCGLVGCGPSVVQQASGPIDATPNRLNRIGQAYLIFKTANKKPPTSVADLNTVVKEPKFGAENLTSERDGQPFVIAWGATEPVANDIMKAPIIAYESKGKENSRWVVRLIDDGVCKLTDQEFSKANFVAGHTPAK